MQGNAWRVGVRGLTGGHSGVEINKGRANANKVLAAALAGTARHACRSIDGRQQGQCHPACVRGRRCRARRTILPRCFAANAAKVRSALPETEQHAEFYCEPAEAGRDAGRGASAVLLALLNAVPNGVQAMSSGHPRPCADLPEPRHPDDGRRCRAILTFSVRSSVNRGEVRRSSISSRRWPARYTAAAYSARLASTLHGSTRRHSPPARGHGRGVTSGPVRPQAGRRGYPCRSGVRYLLRPPARAWTPSRSARRCMTSTPSRERLDIASTARTWDYLVAVLERL